MAIRKQLEEQIRREYEEKLAKERAEEEAMCKAEQVECGKDEKGDYVLFGSYPQTKVTDSSLTSQLNNLVGSLPTSSNSRGWTSYKYYIEDSNATDFMWYCDVNYNGEKYRGVYFDKYRPYWVDYPSKEDNTRQKDNGYIKGNVYWFKYEPIKWRVLEEKGEEAFVACDKLIDSQDYNHTLDNNYANSSIRKWLNNEFYNTAFSEAEKDKILQSVVDNSLASTCDSRNSYVCENTRDKIFLLSSKEATNALYFKDSQARQKKPTDYALCQGVISYGWWWLRSPSCCGCDFARHVDDYGGLYDRDVNLTRYGVCSALSIRLVNESAEEEARRKAEQVERGKDEKGDYVLFGSYPQTKVTDSSLTSRLNNLAGSLPTSSNSGKWTSYDYYIEDSNSTDFMWYCDVSCDGEKYRGVYFDKYRPYWVDYPSEEDNTYQKKNGYSLNTVYWFKYEPIKWRVLEVNGKEAFVACDKLIDSQDYNHTDNNNYANSSIRKWLNTEFYNTAFSEAEKAKILQSVVDNSLASTCDDSNEYVCDNTSDNIFLLSKNEVTNAAYFKDSQARQKRPTDYAQCQGAYSRGWWWIRSPYYFDCCGASHVYDNGDLYYSSVLSVGNGVCSALKMVIE